MNPAIANNARDTTNRTSPEKIMAVARSYAASCVMPRRFINRIFTLIQCLDRPA
jgi:hypothetical protein